MPTISPATDLPVTSAGLSCRLPVVRSTQGGDYASLQGGFITFPQGTFAADPAGVIESEYLQQDFVTIAKPVLHGGGASFYDAAMKRWIPSSPAQTSPDGTSYAYAISGASSSDPTIVHVVDVARATEHLYSLTSFAPGAAVGIHVVDNDGTAVYLVSDQFEGFPIGVWRLDLASGLVRQLKQVSGVMLVRNGYAWVGRIDPRDPAPPRPPRSGQYFDAIARVDLNTGSEVTWFYRPGQAVALRGLDSNARPIVNIAPAPAYDFNQGSFRLLGAPGELGNEISHDRWFNDPQADSGRIWLGNDQGIYLFTATAGL